MKFILNKWRLVCHLVLVPWTIHLILSSLKAFTVTLLNKSIHQSVSHWPLASLPPHTAGGSLILMVIGKCPGRPGRTWNPHLPTGAHRTGLAFKESLWMGKICCCFVSFHFEKEYTEKKKKCSTLTKDLLQLHKTLSSSVCSNPSRPSSPPYSSSLISHHIQAHTFLIPLMAQMFRLSSLTPFPAFAQLPTILRIVLSYRQRLIFSGTVFLINPPLLYNCLSPFLSLNLSVIIVFICICFLFSSPNTLHESWRTSYLYHMSKKCVLIDWIPQVPQRKMLWGSQLGCCFVFLIKKNLE